MSILDDILFWKKKKEKIIVPYRTSDQIKNDDVIMPEEEPKSIWKNLKPIDLSKIETIDFPKSQYFQEIYEKKSIVMHHTVGPTIESTLSEWKSTSDRVATCIIIDRGGIPWQLFSSKYWAAHLKCGNLNLDRHSIAVEIVNWGQLTPTSDGRFKTYYGNKIYTTAQYYPNAYRGYHYFEKYTDAQIITLGELMLYWNMIYNIPLKYRESIWDVTQDARNGVPGIYSHTSYRTDKSDCHPQHELVSMLKTLEKLV